ncbi:hypothetical protein AX16_009864 [Volvariella volvacea WC 439]|nr:hypothetical protein AX16_009864 [Volvariella volvacea WC 439]
MVRGYGSSGSPALKYSQRAPDAPLPFFPPSYYAKAAGLQVPLNANTTSKAVEQESEIEGLLGSGIFPVSYPSEVNSSDTSSEARIPRDTRLSVLTRKRSGSSVRSNLSFHPQGRMAGLPELEAHILPSLRDTVDKMTRPCQRNGATPIASEHRDDGTKASSATIKATASIPGEQSHTLPRAPKYATRLNSRATPKPEQPTASVASSLRTVRSMLTRKLSVPPRTNATRNSAKQGPSYTGRARSTTDPGVLPGTSDMTTVSTQQSPYQRTIRTPLTMSTNEVYSDVTVGQQTDESDVEWGIRGQYLRRLVVTNADITTSSSSSGSEVVSRLHRSPPYIQSSHLHPHTTTRVRNEFELSPAQHHDDVAHLEFLQSDSPSSLPSSQSVHLADRVSALRRPYIQPLPQHSPDTGRKAYIRDRKEHNNLAGLIEDITTLPAFVSHSESDYCGQPGLAIGESADFSVPVMQELDLSADPIYPVNYRRQTAKDSSRIGTSPGTIYSPSAVIHDTVNEPGGIGLGISQCDRYGPFFPSQCATSAPSSTRGILRTNGDNNKSRSASKSPVIRQSKNTSIPLAVRRHLVYHNTPQMTHTAGRSPRPSASQDTRSSPYTNQDAIKSHEPLSHADSGLSSLGKAEWRESYSKLSPGAEQLFRKVGDSESNTLDGRHVRGALGSKTLPHSADIHAPRQSPGRATGLHMTQTQQNEGLLSPSKRLASRIIIVEEIVETEAAFVDRLRLFVRTFILPLRVRGTRSWISGIPVDVSRLLDWFEDIANLHTEMSSCLQDNWNHDSRRIAEHLRPYVLKLEIYQPYLVHLANVSASIDQMVQDPNNDFGTFVKLQQKTDELVGCPMTTFLLEPITRLSKYPKLFSRLLDATTKSHPDYLSSFSLFHSTNLIIKVLTEVKIREDEYELIKHLSKRIKGLPSSSQLAQRERRLLLQGILYVTLTDATFNSLEAQPTTWVSPSLGNLLCPRVPDRTSRLIDAVNQWSLHRQRSDSLASTSTDTSASCYSTTSSTSGTYFSPPRPSQIPVLSSKLKSKPQRADLALPRPLPQLTKEHGLLSVQVFVFTDLLVLTTPTTVGDPQVDEWTLNEEFGVCRVYNVTEVQHDPISFLLDVLPLDLANINEAFQHDSTRMRTVRLTLPASTPTSPSTPTPATITPGLAQTSPADDTTRRSWLSAFRSCLHSTLRLASLGRSDVTDLSSAARETVLSILSSGLPLPKSPSMQQAEYHDGRPADVQRQEREQRGWWSLRFHQVLQELSRQDSSFIV